MVPLLAVLLACSGGTDTGEGGETPEECTPTEVSEDLNGDGVRDTCEDELLYEFIATGDEHLFAETASAAVGLQIAYDTNGAVSTWTTFEPPLALSYEDFGPVRREGRSLSGWADLAARITDEVDETQTLVLTFPDDGERVIWRDEESQLGQNVLKHDVLNEVEFEVLEWTRSDEHPDTIGVRWALYGAPVD